MDRLNTRVAEIWRVKNRVSKDVITKAVVLGRDLSVASGIPVQLPGTDVKDANCSRTVLVEGLYGDTFTYAGVECALSNPRCGSIVVGIDGGTDIYFAYTRVIETGRDRLADVQNLQRTIDATAYEGFVAGSVVKIDPHYPSTVRAEFTLRAEVPTQRLTEVARVIGELDKTIDRVYMG